MSVGRRSALRNRVVAWALRSSGHGLLSGRFALISVVGRRSGRVYTLPVQYVRDGEALAVLSQQDRTWWRNLDLPGGAPVRLLLDGAEVAGRAEVVRDERAIASVLPAFYPRPFRRRLGGARLAAASRGKVVVRVRLDRAGGVGGVGNGGVAGEREGRSTGEP